MTTKTKSNLARLALFVMNENRFGFAMSKFMIRKDRNWDIYDPHQVARSLAKDQIESLCLAGHAPLVLGKTRSKEDWDSYLVRVLLDGPDKGNYGDIEDFLFHPCVGPITRLQAARRVLYLLNEGLSEGSNERDCFTKKYYNSITLAKTAERLEAFVKLDVALDS